MTPRIRRCRSRSSWKAIATAVCASRMTSRRASKPSTPSGRRNSSEAELRSFFQSLKLERHMSIADSKNIEASSPAGTRQMRNAMIASVLGWSLDLFDLFILLYVAPVVGALFFPSTVPTLSLAAVYASFAVTLLMRPVGSAIFGHYADVHGRKNAMFVAIVGVGFSTAAFGVLPTIAQAGYLAPALFLILRLVQGVFVGGVVASTHTIGTESVSPDRRGAMSGLIGGGGAGIGALLASFVFLITSSVFPGEAFAVWGWRCMFFSGLLSSLLGWFIFNNLEES